MTNTIENTIEVRGAVYKIVGVSGSTVLAVDVDSKRLNYFKRDGLGDYLEKELGISKEEYEEMIAKAIEE